MTKSRFKLFDSKLPARALKVQSLIGGDLSERPEIMAEFRSNSG